MKWETSLRTQSCGNNTSEEEESDDEINELKQRIRIRRRERLVEVHTAILLTLSFNCMYITSVIYAISLPLLRRWWRLSTSTLPSWYMYAYHAWHMTSSCFVHHLDWDHASFSSEMFSFYTTLGSTNFWLLLNIPTWFALWRVFLHCSHCSNFFFVRFYCATGWKGSGQEIVILISCVWVSV